MTYKLDSVLCNNNFIENRPYVDIRIDDIRLSGLLDTGASISILGGGGGGNFYKDFTQRGYTLCKDNMISAVVANGNKLISLGYLSLPVTFENQFHFIIIFFCLSRN